MFSEYSRFSSRYKLDFSSLVLLWHSFYVILLRDTSLCGYNNLKRKVNE